jgi:hypothetical protein
LISYGCSNIKLSPHLKDHGKNSSDIWPSPIAVKIVDNQYY